LDDHAFGSAKCLQRIIRYRLTASWPSGKSSRTHRRITPIGPRLGAGPLRSNPPYKLPDGQISHCSEDSIVESFFALVAK
jgi:hypothetical protein